jgi:RNA polymerase sigma-70 factor (ECF subfamily)
MTAQIKALKDSSRECFNAVYVQYHAKLYQYIYNRTQSAYLAQEVVQLTFIKLWENRSKLSEEFTLDIQLFRIAKTILIDQLRKEKVKLKYNDSVINTTEPVFEDNQVADRDTLKHIYDKLETLPPIRKKVFKLSRMQGLSYKQIAEELSISPKTVENHISKALKQIRNAISMFFL